MYNTHSAVLCSIISLCPIVIVSSEQLLHNDLSLLSVLLGSYFNQCVLPSYLGSKYFWLETQVKEGYHDGGNRKKALVTPELLS